MSQIPEREGVVASENHRTMAEQPAISAQPFDPAELMLTPRQPRFHTDPFPYAIIDGYGSPKLYDRLNAEFPPPEAFGYRMYGGKASVGRNATNIDEVLTVAPTWAAIIEFFKSQAFTSDIEKLTKPYFVRAPPDPIATLDRAVIRVRAGAARRLPRPAHGQAGQAGLLPVVFPWNPAGSRHMAARPISLPPRSTDTVRTGRTCTSPSMRSSSASSVTSCQTGWSCS